MIIIDSVHLAYAALILILGCYVANKSASLATLFNEVGGWVVGVGLYSVATPCSLDE